MSMHTLRRLFVATIGLFVLLSGAIIMLLVAVVTLFQSRRFCSEVIARMMGKIAVRISGLTVLLTPEMAERLRQEDRSVIYIANHTDTVDLFVVISLGLQNTRYFLSGFLRKLLPLGLVGYLIGVFWTAPYSQPHKRLRIFQHADDTLRRTGDSVFLTPEGSRIRTGEIGHFNRGAFHLATSLKRNIVPLYIHVPENVGAGMQLIAEPGPVYVQVLPEIDTSNWTLEDLDANRMAVRQIYIDHHNRIRTNGIEASLAAESNG